jgi:hypothetical protein
MVVYYLGAGASYGTFPIYSEMLEKTKIARAELQSNQDSDRMIDFLGLSKSKIIQIPNFFTSLDKLIDGLETHSTVDSFLHNCQFNGSLNEMKLVFESLMFYWHLSNRPNVRYQELLAKFIQYDKEFRMVVKSPITIISWNYDLVIERSISNTLNISLAETAHFINKNIEKHSPTKINLYKLNGSFMSINKNITTLFDYKTSNVNKAILKYLQSDKDSTSIKFGWEDQNSIDYILSLKGIVESAKAVVSIGYSFPEFNKETDHSILSSYSNKVVLQCTDDTFRLTNSFKFKEKNTLIEILGWNSNMISQNFKIDGNLESFHVPLLVQESRYLSYL